MSQDLSAVLAKQAKSSDFWKGAALYERCINGHKTSLKAADALYTYGYELMGMSYSVYIHQVIEQVIALDIDHVMFVAREGYIFKEIYKSLQAQLPANRRAKATTHYTYLSRVSTFLASTPQLTTRELELITYKFDQKGLWSALKYVGLPTEDFQPLAAEYGIEMQRPVRAYWTDQKLIAFLNDHRVQDKVWAHHQKAYDNLYTYLEQCQFWGKHRKVALVDIGWDGTIQDNLVRTFNHLPEFPLVHGLYFGRRNMKPVLRYSSSFSNGLIFDRRNYDINGESIQSCATLFEKGAGAPHASTIGHQRTADGSVQPIFKSEQSLSRQGEVVADAAVAVMQQGALDFAHHYAYHVSEPGRGYDTFPASTYAPFVRGLLTRQVVFPTRKEAQLIASRLGEFSEDMGEDTLRSVAVTSTDLWNLLKAGKFKAVKRRISGSTWRSATVKLLGIPGVHFLFVLKRFLFF
ncbi:MAG: hypothetical protein ACFB16_18600 [Phormidesmis sp.]